MKISGSHIEQINSVSTNLLRVKEQATITATTENLSREGKHIVNIIHGTPSQFAGTIYKDITFLWEADTESPEYQQAQERKAQAQAKEEKLQQCKSMELEIANLEQRIKYAEEGTAKSPALFLFIAISFSAVGILGLVCESFILGAILTVLGIMNFIIWILEKSEADAANKRIVSDKMQIPQLKEDLEAKKVELNNFKIENNL